MAASVCLCKSEASLTTCACCPIPMQRERSGAACLPASDPCKEQGRHWTRLSINPIVHYSRHGPESDRKQPKSPLLPTAARHLRLNIASGSTHRFTVAVTHVCMKHTKCCLAQVHPSQRQLGKGSHLANCRGTKPFQRPHPPESCAETVFLFSHSVRCTLLRFSTTAH